MSLVPKVGVLSCRFGETLPFKSASNPPKIVQKCAKMLQISLEPACKTVQDWSQNAPKPTRIWSYAPRKKSKPSIQKSTRLCLRRLKPNGVGKGFSTSVFTNLKIATNGFIPISPAMDRHSRAQKHAPIALWRGASLRDRGPSSLR